MWPVGPPSEPDDIALTERAETSAGEIEAGLPGGGGELGRMMRAHPWERSALGPPDGWPQRLRALVDLMLDSRQPMFIAWGDARTMLYNDGYAPMLGQRHPWALGHPFDEVWADILRDVGPIMDRAYAGQSTQMDDLVLVMHRHGYPEEAHFAFSYTPVRDDSGRVAGMLCACAETTAEVLAERRIAFQLALGDRLRGLDDPHQVTMAAAGAIGRHLGAARAGYGEIDAGVITVAVERDWTADAATPSLAGEARLLDAFGPAIIAELRAGRTLRVEDCLADPRAGERYAATWASIGTRSLIVVPLVKGGCLRAILYIHEPRRRRWTDAEAAVAEDVAERTWEAVERARAEAALRALNANLEHQVDERTRERDRLWSVSQDPLVIADADGVWLSASPAWEAVLGRKPADLVGRTSEWMTHPEDRPGRRAALARIFAGEPGFRFGQRLLHRDGSYRWVEWHAIADGGRLFAIARDVTAERGAAEELAQVNRQLLAQIEERERVEATLHQMQRLEAVGQLTAGMAHDFNNLLTVILGGVGFLQRELERRGIEGVALQRLAHMHAAAERGAKLIAQLLAFSRRQRLEAKRLDLNETVIGMTDLLRATVGASVRIKTALADEPCRALADPTQVELVILNLAINARDATRPGGAVTIETVNARLEDQPAAPEEPAPGDYVAVTVRDTGSGMTSEVRARALEPFFTTKEAGKGSGLGLSQVVGFAKQSGGGVCIDTRPGEGTSVTVYLPRATSAADPADAPAAPPPRARDHGRPPVILVVDDERMVREVTATMLQQAGYSVTTAANGDEALAVLGRTAEPIDMLVVDFAMAGMNGIEVAHEARALRPALPILLVTGYPDLGALRELADDEILRKPFRDGELVERVKRALAGGLVAWPRRPAG